MTFTHKVVLIGRTGERQIASFTSRNAFGVSAFRRFRSIVRVYESTLAVPILTPAKFVRDTTIAGGHYQMQNGNVLELR